MISRTLTISDIFSKFPHQSQRLSQAMTNAGLHCTTCSAASYESLEQGMRSHGKTEEEIDALLKKLNAILAEKIDTTTICFTPKGAKKFLEIAEEEGKSGYALRFGVKGGGCSGSQYILDFTQAPTPTDTIFESHGVTIFVDNDSLDNLMGSIIDFEDGLQGAGFKITNPNVRRSCGCGNSQGF